MTIPKNAKHKKYALYAEHCLALAEIATDQKSRIIQREMAAEWLCWQMLFPFNRIRSDAATKLSECPECILLRYRPLLDGTVEERRVDLHYVNVRLTKERKP